jgi:hypothetical protein
VREVASSGNSSILGSVDSGANKTFQYIVLTRRVRLPCFAFFFRPLSNSAATIMKTSQSPSCIGREVQVYIPLLVPPLVWRGSDAAAAGVWVFPRGASVAAAFWVFPRGAAGAAAVLAFFRGWACSAGGS